MNMVSSPKKSNSIQKYRFIYHFLPHKTHKKRSFFLKHHSLAVYSLSIIFLFSTFKLLPKAFPGILGYASNIEMTDLLLYTNERRAKVGLKPLSLNENLNRAAAAKARDMFRVGYWAHISPLGTKPWDFILGENYDYVYAGENLAKNFSNSKDVVDAWYDSQSHRENLLSANYDDIGFAIVNGVLDGYETTIVVQMFGRSRIPTQLATVETPQNPIPQVQPAVEEPKIALQQEVVFPIEDTEFAEVQNSSVFVDVKRASVSLTLVFGLFVVALLGLDMWYSNKHGIVKITGHTLAHLVFLVVTIVGVMLSILPGVVL